MGHYIIEALILIKTNALATQAGNFDAHVQLSEDSIQELTCLIGFPHLPLHMQCLVMHPTLHGVSTSLQPQGVHEMHTKLHLISM